MKADKNLTSGNTDLLLLKLLESRAMYGYEMMEELERRSCQVFSLKAGTLYPILHGLEQKGLIHSYESVSDNGRRRKYYELTKTGGRYLKQKEEKWQTYAAAVNQVLGGVCDAAIGSGKAVY